MFLFLFLLLFLPLQTNRTLTSLTLDGNSVGDTGTKAIAVALAGNPGSALSMLDLTENILTDDGLKAVIDMLMVK